MHRDDSCSFCSQLAGLDRIVHCPARRQLLVAQGLRGHLDKSMFVANLSLDLPRPISAKISTYSIRSRRPRYLRVSAVALSEPAAPRVQLLVAKVSCCRRYENLVVGSLCSCLTMLLSGDWSGRSPAMYS